MRNGSSTVLDRPGSVGTTQKEEIDSRDTRVAVGIDTKPIISPRILEQLGDAVAGGIDELENESRDRRAFTKDRSIGAGDLCSEQGVRAAKRFRGLFGGQ